MPDLALVGGGIGTGAPKFCQFSTRIQTRLFTLEFANWSSVQFRWCAVNKPLYSPTVVLVILRLIATASVPPIPIQTEWHGRSVGREPCKNGWIDRNASAVDSGRFKEQCIGWGHEYPYFVKIAVFRRILASHSSYFSFSLLPSSSLAFSLSFSSYFLLW